MHDLDLIRLGTVQKPGNMAVVHHHIRSLIPRISGISKIS